MRRRDKKTNRVLALLGIGLLVCAFASGRPAFAEGPFAFSLPLGCRISHGLPDQADTLICVPSDWNGELIVYAHGYQFPPDPVLPWDELSRFPDLVELVVSSGYAFATTSYSTAGDAVEEAEGDILDLVDQVEDQAGSASKVFVVGASEGGLIATMMVEKHPEVFNGGALTMCGPIGGMPFQVRYLADFRVVFDYFFPGVFRHPDDPATPLYVDPDKYGPGEFEYAYNTACGNFDPYLVEGITAALLGGGEKTDDLFDVTRAARGMWPDQDVEAAIGILKYSICGSVDLVDKAGGMPYGNRFRWYRGTGSWWDDKELNAGVERVSSDPEARRYVADFYRPTGELEVPVVSLHNLKDPIVPYRHELIYMARVALKGRSRFLRAYPSLFNQYGHCEFAPEEVIFGLAQLGVELNLDGLSP
ncbi:MAG: hypothetical protein JRH07_09790 [Deltaproteobacteria bacterium]|nr:hypothetical protein [Deltaproteobacteria bacterium]MBW2122121.1 hypothetical protein [Deltaproteobacteria bacterium]